ncbi:MAG: DJ-1/PfpI family protein [Bacteroidales bacterium]|nr:DJ-1/PfpI family protein [Bacteroidales bacterium]
MKGVYIFLAEGFEDMEAIGTRDVLVRGGVDVKTVSLDGKREVTSSHGTTVRADMVRSEFDTQPGRELADRKDVLIFPGGMPGSKFLAGDRPLMELMKRHYVLGGTVAAICAAPGLVASQLSPLSGIRFTCFDGFERYMTEKGAVYTPESTVVDGHLITGRGAGHAIAFGLAILAYLEGEEAAAKVRAGLML